MYDHLFIQSLHYIPVCLLADIKHDSLETVSIQLKHRAVTANINAREKTYTAVLGPGFLRICTPGRCPGPGVTRQRPTPQAPVGAAPPAALPGHSPALCAPFPAILFGKPDRAAPHLLWNVFSIFPKDSAPDQDLAGRETPGVSGPGRAGGSGVRAGGRRALTCRTPAPA